MCYISNHGHLIRVGPSASGKGLRIPVLHLEILSDTRVLRIGRIFSLKYLALGRHQNWFLEDGPYRSMS
jgi:hypothetical protein